MLVKSKARVKSHALVFNNVRRYKFFSYEGETDIWRFLTFADFHKQ